jgi:hypothetical protein
MVKFFILQIEKSYWHFLFIYKREKLFLNQNMDKKNGIYFNNYMEKNGIISRI